MSGQSVFIQHPNRKGPVLVDDLSKALAAISVSQCQLHLGLKFSVSTFDVAFGSGAVMDILVRVAATNDAYVDAFFVATGDATCEIFEGPTTSADGTPLAVIQRARPSANIADTLFFDGPTVSAPGISLGTLLIPGGSGGNSPGAVAESPVGIIMAEGDYLMRVTNLTGQTQALNVIVNFYEGKVL